MQRASVMLKACYTFFMKALVITNLTGPEGLALQDVAEATAQPPRILVRVGAGGLNFADFMTTKGGYPGTPPPPLIAGREFAGVEESTNRRVMGYLQWGAFAEKAAAYPNLLWPTPEGWSDEQAAAFPVNYFTAYLGYWQAGMTQPRNDGGTHRVLIHAVAGGVGTAAVQIGKLLGVDMYGTSSSDEKLARVEKLGLEHGINYRRNNYEEVVKNLTRGEGVDAVFEMLGGEHTARSLRCLRDFGKVIQYGTATGKSPQLDLRAMYAKSASVQGLWLTYLSQKPEIMEPAWKQLSGWIQQGKLSPQIGQIFPLEKAVEAYKLLEEGKNYGKLVVRINQ
ncbi:MAG TPA: NADPH:quinone oxidoreductase family protein [Candidatus Eisenbacteria bacterium]|nr:NADPH:quinone oxidoreductase family protein [Candidatus Eisenbacteria bacterium]